LGRPEQVLNLLNFWVQIHYCTFVPSLFDEPPNREDGKHARHVYVPIARSFSHRCHKV
jgi:hypothetical protein